MCHDVDCKTKTSNCSISRFGCLGVTVMRYVVPQPLETQPQICSTMKVLPLVLKLSYQTTQTRNPLLYKGHLQNRKMARLLPSWCQCMMPIPLINNSISSRVFHVVFFYINVSQFALFSSSAIVQTLGILLHKSCHHIIIEMGTIYRPRGLRPRRLKSPVEARAPAGPVSICM